MVTNGPHKTSQNVFNKFYRWKTVFPLSFSYFTTVPRFKKICFPHRWSKFCIYIFLSLWVLRPAPPLNCSTRMNIEPTATQADTASAEQLPLIIAINESSAVYIFLLLPPAAKYLSDLSSLWCAISNNLWPFYLSCCTMLNQKKKYFNGQRTCAIIIILRN